MQSLKLHGFTFGKKIGKGSFCKVMKAEYKDKKTGQITKLACKWIDKTNASKYFLEKFLSQEIKVILRICNEHPFIIEFHSILEDNRSCFIFMRRAENLDLLGYLQKHRKVSESQANLWTYQLASALQYLHGLDYAHRDLKCENIFLTEHKNIRLGDFGFARYCGDGGTFSQTFCGTHFYSAPEIVKQLKYNPKKSDIWSLGIVIFILIYGEFPFKATSITEIIREQNCRIYKNIQKQNKRIKVSVECQEVIDELLEADPEKRIDINTLCGMDWLDKKLIKLPSNV